MTQSAPSLPPNSTQAITVDIPPEAPDPLNERESYLPLVRELAGNLYQTPDGRTIGAVNGWWREGEERVMYYYIPTSGTTGFVAGNADYRRWFLEDATDVQPLSDEYAGYVVAYLENTLPALAPYMRVQWTSSADQASAWREQGLAMVTIFAADHPENAGWTNGEPGGFPRSDSMIALNTVSTDAWGSLRLLAFLNTLVHEDGHRFGRRHMGGYFLGRDEHGNSRGFMPMSPGQLPGMSVMGDWDSPVIFVGGEMLPIGVLDIALFAAENGGVPLPMAQKSYDWTDMQALYPRADDGTVPLPVTCAALCVFTAGDGDHVIDAANGSLSTIMATVNVYGTPTTLPMTMGLIGELTSIRTGDGDNIIYVAGGTTELSLGRGRDTINVLVPVAGLSVHDVSGGGALRVSPDVFGEAILVRAEGQDILLSSGGVNIRIVGGVSASGVSRLELVRADGTIAPLSAADLGFGGLANWQQAVDALNAALGYVTVTPTPAPTDAGGGPVDPPVTPVPGGGDYLVQGDACYVSPEELNAVMATRDALVAWLTARASGACAGQFTYTRYTAGGGWQLESGQIWNGFVPTGLTVREIRAHNGAMVQAYNDRDFAAAGDGGAVTVVDMCVGAEDLPLSASGSETLARLLNLRNGEDGTGTPAECLRVR